MNATVKITGTEAPLPFQAEVLRGQLCDDVNRRYWAARKQIMADFEDEKARVESDYNRMSSADFLAKYRDWKFL
jgi:hypothetical protein